MSETLNITLPDDALRFIDESVQSGRYASTSELVQDALRALQGEADSVDDFDLSHLRDRVQASLNDPRPSVPIEEAFDRLKARVRSRALSATKV